MHVLTAVGAMQLLHVLSQTEAPVVSQRGGKLPVRLLFQPRQENNQLPSLAREPDRAEAAVKILHFLHRETFLDQASDQLGSASLGHSNCGSNIERRRPDRFVKESQ